MEAIVKGLLQKERQLTTAAMALQIGPAVSSHLLGDLVGIIIDYSAEFDVMNWEDVWFRTINTASKLHHDDDNGEFYAFICTAKASSVDVQTWMMTALAHFHHFHHVHSLSYLMAYSAVACCRPTCWFDRCHCKRPLIITK